MDRPLGLPRRDFLKLSAAGALSAYSTPWFGDLARAAEIRRPRGKACILLWMDGGPSQQHTFDPKPTGQFKGVPTTVPGIRICEPFPQVAQCMDDIALLRSMRTDINVHYDAKYYLHTGFRRVTGFEHPSIGSIAASEVAPRESDMPGFVTIDAGYDLRLDGGRLYRPVAGYIGPRYSPLAVNEPTRGLENLRTADESLNARLGLLSSSESRFAREYPLPAVAAHQSAASRAVRLMQSTRARAFNIEEERTSTREMYGMHRFGQSCLLARRLVESGVSFVEIFHRGWDDHGGAAANMVQRAPWLDRAMAALIRDLKQRGMLDDTLVVWMGEFGRSPGVGEGHFANAWTTLWAGGGIKTGQAVGRTSESERNPGSTVVERPISAADYMATLCLALGIDIHHEFHGPGNRPMPIVDPAANPVRELLS